MSAVTAFLPVRRPREPTSASSGRGGCAATLRNAGFARPGPPSAPSGGRDTAPCGRSRWGRILLPGLLCLAAVAEGAAQPARTQGWVLGLGSGAAAVSFERDPGDRGALVDLRVGYGLNRIVTPYLGGAYADIRTRGLEAFDRVTFSHADIGVRLHLAAGRRRWVPYGDLALTFWRLTDVIPGGERAAAADFTSLPTLSAGGGFAVYLSESWALDLNVKAARGTFGGVPAGGSPAGHRGAVSRLDAASVRVGAGFSWWPSGH